LSIARRATAASIWAEIASSVIGYLPIGVAIRGGPTSGKTTSAIFRECQDRQKRNRNAFEPLPDQHQRERAHMYIGIGGLILLIILLVILF
jgi:hypothetical protein